MTTTNMGSPMRLRSVLFVPGVRPERFDKALASGADAVIIDLEDAVAPGEKDVARAAVVAWLQARAAVAPLHTMASLLLRVNGVDTPAFADDLTLVHHPAWGGIVLPKVETAASMGALRGAGVHTVIPMIETLAGLDAATEIASAPGVSRLAFGSLDFQADLGMRDALDEELLPFRAQLVMASRRAGIGAPIDGVTTAIDNAEILSADVRRARRLGFAGKLCIHPRQVTLVNTLFAPTPDEIAWATRVVAATDATRGGAVAVDGMMVDTPVLLRAQAILADAD
jgi:citrate lyase subunit beta/citryl-CoA lyase